MPLDHIPNSVQIKAQIAVNKHIPKTGDSVPIDIRMPPLEAIGEPLRRFGKNLQVPYGCILHQIGAKKRILTAFGELLDASNRVSNVNKVEPVVCHSGTASLSTRSRIYQCKPDSVTTSTLRPSRSCRSIWK